MIKINALDFLNKEQFGADLLSENGDVLFSAEDKITPNIILKLYFQDIFINEQISEIEDTEEISQLTESDNSSKKPNLNLNKPLKFNEEQAKRVVHYSLEIGKSLGLSQNELEELEQAAYYHNIGDIKFKQKDLLDKDFRKKRAEEGYNYILKDKGLSGKVADVAKLYIENYNCNTFDISKTTSATPFYHIIAITNYYDEYLTKTSSKEETIRKMLRLGRKKFNTYILHKFVTMMRNNNE